jgi:membrane protein
MGDPRGLQVATAAGTVRSPGRAGEFGRRLLERAAREFLDDHCPQLAAGISYHVLFSIFPLAVVLTAVFAIVVRAQGVRADVVDTIVSAVPPSGSGAHSVRSLLDGATGGASAVGLVGLLGLAYAASGMMGCTTT